MSVFGESVTVPLYHSSIVLYTLALRSLLPVEKKNQTNPSTERSFGAVRRGFSCCGYILTSITYNAYSS